MEFSEITPNVTMSIYSKDGSFVAMTNGLKLIV